MGFQVDATAWMLTTCTSALLSAVGFAHELLPNPAPPPTHRARGIQKMKEELRRHQSHFGFWVIRGLLAAKCTHESASR